MMQVEVGSKHRTVDHATNQGQRWSNLLVGWPAGRLFYSGLGRLARKQSSVALGEPAFQSRADLSCDSSLAR